MPSNLFRTATSEYANRGEAGRSPRRGEKRREEAGRVKLKVERLSVCVCVFIELHITAQSGPVIPVILCHSH